MTEVPKKAVIIGASGGIGTQLCALLRGSGWSLVLAGRDQAKLEQLQQSLGGGVESIHALEASDFDAVDEMLALHKDATGLANLAGSILLKPSSSTSRDDFDKTIAQNLTTAFSCVRAAGKHMRKNGGSVVLMSSCAAQIGLGNHEAISAAKAGVEGLARSAAASYASNNIRFNAIAPGLVDTPLASGILASEPARKASESMHPLKRIGQPQEVARVISMLLEPDSSWITGQVIGVDGGMAMVRPK
jgi:3-oxoacyl-[acyl-carrier protein] reductase